MKKFWIIVLGILFIVTTISFFWMVTDIIVFLRTGNFNYYSTYSSLCLYLIWVFFFNEK